MKYTLTYKVGTTIKRVSLDEQVAKAVQEKIAKSEVSSFLKVGEELVKVGQIQSVTPDEQQQRGVTKKQLRESLRAAARACFKGPLRDRDGSCRGCVERVDGTMDLCECQANVKKSYGIDPRDYDYLYNEFEFNS